MFQDKKADLLINGYVDDVLVKVMKKMGLEIPDYSNNIDPTRCEEDIVLDWTIRKENITEIKQLYNMYCKNHRKRKSIDKNIKKSAQIKRDGDCKFQTAVLKDVI